MGPDRSEVPPDRLDPGSRFQKRAKESFPQNLPTQGGEGPPPSPITDFSDLFKFWSSSRGQKSLVSVWV